MRNLSVCIMLAALTAGCFNEPEPAYKSVPAEARLYLHDKGLKIFDDQAFATFKVRADIVDYLNLDRNQLTNVDAVAKIHGLKWLRLNDNRLNSLPSLAELKSLRRIYLRGNRFTEVPETLKDLSALTDIDIAGNPINKVPEWLAKKTGLQHLSLSLTMIRELPQDISAWQSLKTLQLGELQLSSAEMARIRKALPKTAVVY